MAPWDLYKALSRTPCLEEPDPEIPQLFLQILVAVLVPWGLACRNFRCGEKAGAASGGCRESVLLRSCATTSSYPKLLSQGDRKVASKLD